ncbi:hypothetical protein DFQ30_006982, partial [Apophysomyces sp. BC1015]
MNPSDNFVTINGKKLYPVQQPLPQFPTNGFPDRGTVRKVLNEYAVANNFTLATKFSTPTKLYLKCTKGGSYRNTRNLQDSDRKKLCETALVGCPYLLRLYLRKDLGFCLVEPKNEEERHHNHPITPESLSTSSKARKLMLTEDDIRNLTTMVDANVSTRCIQKALNEENVLRNKLTVHDINNLKYQSTKRSSVDLHETATILVRQMEDKGYTVLYEHDGSGRLQRLFFTSKTMVERAR